MKVNPSLLPFAAALLALGCTKEEPALGRATAPESSAPSASIAATEAPKAHCPLEVRRLTFTGCNPQPSQDVYPECTSYELGPATEHADHGCIPGLLRLAVSGYPGRLEVALVEAKPLADGKAEGKIQLTLDALLQSSSESGWTKGTVLGELVLQDSRVEALALTGALKVSSFGLTRVSCPGVEGAAGDCLLTGGVSR